MPLLAGDELIGVLVVEGGQETVFSERDKLMLRSLRAYASVGLANAIAYRGLESALGKLDITRNELEQKNTLLEKAYEQQREASLTDSLTGLHNRRFLLERIDDEVSLTWRRQQQRAHGEPRMYEDGDLIFYIVDIDHFKSVNDQHGHGAGDHVLVQVAQRLRAAARETDYVVRWGGAEFMVVARATSAEHASLLAERLRHAIASVPFDIGDGQRLEHLLRGFAGLPFHPAAAGVGSWTDIVELAGQALYMAKQGGRNRWFGLAAGRMAPSLEQFEAIKLDAQAALGRGELRLLGASTPSSTCQNASVPPIGDWPADGLHAVFTLVSSAAPATSRAFFDDAEKLRQMAFEMPPARDRRPVDRPPDLRVAGRLHLPLAVVEFKAARVPRQAEVVDQAARLVLEVGHHGHADLQQASVRQTSRQCRIRSR